MNTRNLVPGVILIALGALFLIVQLTEVGGEAVVALIGGAFLVACAFTRQYGFRVPGGIMTGLGLPANSSPGSTGPGSGHSAVPFEQLGARCVHGVARRVGWTHIDPFSHVSCVCW